MTLSRRIWRVAGGRHSRFRRCSKAAMPRTVQFGCSGGSTGSPPTALFLTARQRDGAVARQRGSGAARGTNAHLGQRDSLPAVLGRAVLDRHPGQQEPPPGLILTAPTSRPRGWFGRSLAPACRRRCRSQRGCRGRHRGATARSSSIARVLRVVIVVQDHHIVREIRRRARRHQPAPFRHCIRAGDPGRAGAGGGGPDGSAKFTCQPMRVQILKGASGTPPRRHRSG